MKYPSKILNKASDRARVSENIPENEYRLMMEITNTQPDSHYHIITEDLVKKFKKQINGDLPFISNHEMGKPLGNFVRGYIDDERLIAEASVLRDWNYGISTNEFIKGVEGDKLKDVSIGARVKDVECNICGKQAFISRKARSYDEVCWEHRPGQVINSKLIKNKTVYWIVNDGYLVEVSSVISGANHNAKILDHTKKMAEEIDLFSAFEADDTFFDDILPFLDDAADLMKSAIDDDPHYAHLLIKSKNGSTSYPNHNGGTTDMSLEQELAKLQGEASAFIDDLPDEPAKAVKAIIEKCKTLATENTTLKSDVDTHKADADKYNAHRDTVIEAAVASGVIAEGETFNKEEWTEILKGYSNLELIDKQEAAWKKDAETSAPEGEGRQSVDGAPNGKTEKTEESVVILDDADSYL